MPFNYKRNIPNPTFTPVGVDLIQAGNKNPFQIAGTAMTELNDIVDNRNFRKSIGKAQGLEDLTSMVARTPEQEKMIADRRGVFTALEAQKRGDLLNQLTQAQIASAGKFAPKGFKFIADPVRGGISIGDMDTGEIVSATSGASSGEIPISSKTPTVALKDGREVYADFQGKPIMKGGNYIVKKESTESIKQTQADASMGNVLDKLEFFKGTVLNNPKAIGSFGENPLNWVANNINDLLKIPTTDRLSRAKIIQFNDALAASLRKISGEVGTMTDADVERYLKELGTEDDSTKEYLGKLKTLRKTMIEDMNRKKKAFGKESEIIDIKDDVNATDINTTVDLTKFGF